MNGRSFNTEKRPPKNCLIFSVKRGKCLGAELIYNRLKSWTVNELLRLTCPGSRKKGLHSDAWEGCLWPREIFRGKRGRLILPGELTQSVGARFYQWPGPSKLLTRPIFWLLLQLRTRCVYSGWPGSACKRNCIWPIESTGNSRETLLTGIHDARCICNCSFL